MQACVIGGSGFLGSHVADQLSAAGHKVNVYDRHPSLWLQKGQTMFLGNLITGEGLKEAIAGCDIVYNFAALADLNDALDKPVETVEVNVLGNVRALDLCRELGVNRFMYASTIYVYSREGGFYRCSKQAAEHYVEEFYKIYGLNYTILRYGSLYGPRTNDSNGLYRVVRQLETGLLSYNGSPDTLREYIHVEDAARASVAILGEDFKNESVVLTGQEPMRVLDMLEMLSEILGLGNRASFISGDQLGHYVRTPYAYQPKLSRKYVLPMHVDLGQGLLQLIENVLEENPNLIWPK